MDFSLEDYEESGGDYLISREVDKNADSNEDNNADYNKDYNEDSNSLESEEPVVKTRVKRMGS